MDQMLKGGVIMDVVDAAGQDRRGGRGRRRQALERVPEDRRRTAGSPDE